MQGHTLKITATAGEKKRYLSGRCDLERQAYVSGNKCDFQINDVLTQIQYGGCLNPVFWEMAYFNICTATKR